MLHKIIYSFLGVVAIISFIISVLYIFYLHNLPKGLLTLSTGLSLIGLLVFWMFNYRILPLFLFIISCLISFIYIKIRYFPFLINISFFLIFVQSFFKKK